MFLAIDLVLNKQDGLSRGLRFLFDRNDSHLAVCSISTLVATVVNFNIGHTIKRLSPTSHD